MVKSRHVIAHTTLLSLYNNKTCVFKTLIDGCEVHTHMEWKSDWGLRIRMIVSLLGLAGLYVLFGVGLTMAFDAAVIIIPVLILFALLQYSYSPQLALYAMDAKPVSEQEYPELHDRVHRLSQQGNIPMPSIAVSPHKTPNAFATGTSKHNATICVTQGLLEKITMDDELDAILAHELSHVKNNDVVILTVVSFLTTMSFFIVRHFWLFGDGGASGGENGQPWFLAFFVISIAVWIGSYIITRALSRYREFAADKGAVMITGKPSAMASALQTISNEMESVPSDDLRSGGAMNAFFIVPDDTGSRVLRLMSTHPNIEKRVARIEKIEQEK